MGAALNGFSLNETGALSAAIEKTGQAADATYMSTTKLVSQFDCFYLVWATEIGTLATGIGAKLG